MPVYLFLSSRVRCFYFLPPVCRKIPEIESQQKGKFCDFWTCSIMIPWRDSASWIQIFIFSRSDIIIIIYLIFIFCKGYAFEIILKQKLNTSDFFSELNLYIVAEHFYFGGNMSSDMKTLNWKVFDQLKLVFSVHLFRSQNTKVFFLTSLHIWHNQYMRKVIKC